MIGITVQIQAISRSPKSKKMFLEGSFMHNSSMEASRIIFLSKDKKDYQSQQMMETSLAPEKGHNQAFYVKEFWLMFNSQL